MGICKGKQNMFHNKVFAGFLLSVSSPYPHFSEFLGFYDYDPELSVPPVTAWMFFEFKNQTKSAECRPI